MLINISCRSLIFKNVSMVSHACLIPHSNIQYMAASVETANTLLPHEHEFPISDRCRGTKLFDFGSSSLQGLGDDSVRLT